MRSRVLVLAVCGGLALAACGGREPAPSQPAPGEPAPSTASHADAVAGPTVEPAVEVGVEGDEAYVRIDRCDESHGPDLDEVRLKRGIGRCYVDAGLTGQ